MVQRINNANRQKALLFLMFQMLFGAILAVFVGYIWEVTTGQSFFVGVMLDIIPSLVFTLYAFRFGGAQRIQMVAASFYRGETVKIMLTGALVIVVIKFIPVEFFALLIGFLIMKLSQFLKTIFF